MPENEKHKKKGTVDEDQKGRAYYYDDSHGYEDYDPESEDQDDEAEANCEGSEPPAVAGG